MATLTIEEQVLASLEAKLEFYQLRADLPDADIEAFATWVNGGTLTLISEFAIEKVTNLADSLQKMKDSAPTKVAEIQAVIDDIND